MSLLDKLKQFSHLRPDPGIPHEKKLSIQESAIEVAKAVYADMSSARYGEFIQTRTQDEEIVRFRVQIDQLERVKEKLVQENEALRRKLEILDGMVESMKEVPADYRVLHRTISAQRKALKDMNSLVKHYRERFNKP